MLCLNPSSQWRKHWSWCANIEINLRLKSWFSVLVLSINLLFIWIWLIISLNIICGLNAVWYLNGRVVFFFFNKKIIINIIIFIEIIFFILFSVTITFSRLWKAFLLNILIGVGTVKFNCFLVNFWNLLSNLVRAVINFALVVYFEIYIFCLFYKCWLIIAAIAGNSNRNRIGSRSRLVFNSQKIFFQVILSWISIKVDPISSFSALSRIFSFTWFLFMSRDIIYFFRLVVFLIIIILNLIVLFKISVFFFIIFFLDRSSILLAMSLSLLIDCLSVINKLFLTILFI